MEWLPYDAEDARAQPSTAEDRPDMRWLATCMQTLFLATPLSQSANSSITVCDNIAAGQHTASDASAYVAPHKVQDDLHAEQRLACAVHAQRMTVCRAVAQLQLLHASMRPAL